MQPFKSKDIIYSFIITAIFNTIIAIVLTYMVMDENSFFNVFMISQLIGLSICLCVNIAVHFTHGNKWNVPANVTGLVMGIFMGSLLSWSFLSYFHGNDFNSFLKNVFLYVFVFGIVFGVPISYFFSSREKIIESEKLIQKEKIQIIKRSFTNQMIIGFDQTNQTIAVSRAYEHLFKHM